MTNNQNLVVRNFRNLVGNIVEASLAFSDLKLVR
jgi:hypothetical protein